MAVPKAEPYIHVTWLTKLLVGEDSCEWASWFKAHHKYEQVKDDFDFTSWQIAHTVLLNKVRDELESGGRAVFTEKQNNFVLPGASGVVLGGQADLVATSGTTGLIVDLKTGRPRPSDHAQVLIYMWALPLALRKYHGIEFSGRVVYSDGHALNIPASAVDETFEANLLALLSRIGNEKPLRKVPSLTECGYCKIPKSECPDRIEEMDMNDLEPIPEF